MNPLFPQIANSQTPWSFQNSGQTNDCSDTQILSLLPYSQASQTWCILVITPCHTHLHTVHTFYGLSSFSPTDTQAPETPGPTPSAALKSTGFVHVHTVQKSLQPGIELEMECNEKAEQTVGIKCRTACWPGACLYTTGSFQSTLPQSTSLSMPLVTDLNIAE